MILQIENWHMGYSQILADCRGGDAATAAAADDGGSVLLLCSPNVDAMAAARILAYMLRNDGVAYHLQPCWSLTSLQNQIASQPAVRAVVLINLGALKNLTRLFDNNSNGGGGGGGGDTHTSAAATETIATPTTLLDPRRTKIYVMDCRRPIHLANVHADNHVVVFWDGVGVDDNANGVDPEKALPSDGDDLSGQEESSEEEEEDEEEDEGDEEDMEQEDDDNQDDGEAEFEGEFENNDDDIDEDDDAVMGDARQQQKQQHHDTGADDYDGEDEQDEDEEEDDDDDDDKENVKRRRTGDPKKSSSSSSSSSSGKTDTETMTSAAEDDENPNTQSQSQSQSPPQQQLPSLTPRQLHKERRDRIRLYYASGTYFGSPAAFVAYTVATQLRFGEIADLLWLACVGVTDAYQHARLDVSGYSTLAMQLRNSCLKLFPNDSYTRVSNTVYAEHLTGQQPSYAGNNNNRHQDTALTKIGVSANGTILAETDYRFFLLRHSSLWEAMVLSDYCATRLQLTTARGIYKLQELLAQMGFPLTECQQPFTFMKPSLRRKLAQKLRDHAPDFGLPHLEFTSFVRITGYQSLLSASDTSLALSALLECSGSGARRRHRHEHQQSSSIEQEDEEAFLQSFNAAFDALNANAHHLHATGSGSANTITSLLSSGEGSSLANLVNGGSLSAAGLGAGIRLAMALQRSIMNTAAGLVDRNAITRLSHFRYAYVTCSSGGGSGTKTAQPGQSTSERLDNNDGGSKQDHVFSKPLALTRLAHYLMDLHRENGKWTGAKARPLILLAEKPRTNSFVVVGYEYPERAGDLVKNRFGQNFALAAQSMNGTFRFDSFDSNVVEVAASDAQRFLEQLHYLLDSAMQMDSF